MFVRNVLYGIIAKPDDSANLEEQNIMSEPTGKPKDAPNRRAVFIINPRFQYRFLVWMSSAGIVIAASFFAAHKFFFHSFIQKGQAAGLPADHIFFTFLAKQEASLDRIFLGACLVVFIAVVYFSMRLSNKIAGPLYRLDRHMQAVAEGKTDHPVTFREGDYFLELAVSYNAQLERLKGK